MIETWKIIPDYPSYSASSLGRVKSLLFDKERILSHTYHNGYRRTRVSKDGKAAFHDVHQLVAMAFLGYRAGNRYVVVNHKDFDRSNNQLSNLEVVPARINNSKKHLSHTSKYTGVSWNTQHQKWVAQTYLKARKVYLGVYANELDAKNAYDEYWKNIESLTTKGK